MAEGGSIFALEDSNSSSCIPEGEERRQIFAGVVVAIVVVGLVGNVLVFSTILILREYKKSVTNWYILQLTLADSLFLLMLPFTAHSEIVGQWEFSLSLCKFKEALLFINYYASIYFLVVMSFDRYLAVTKAFASKKWVTSLRSPIASYIISVCGWVLSVLLCIQLFRYSSILKQGSCEICAYNFPVDEDVEMESFSGEDVVVDEELSIQDILSSYYYQLQGDLKTTSACSFRPSTVLTVWLYGNFFGAFCLPFLLICFFYGMIIRTIRAASKVGNTERQRSYRRRVTMIVLALVTLFAVSWIPWYVEKLAKIYGISLSSEACTNLEYAVRTIAFLNSALNPYFYSFLGTHFRDRLLRAGSQVRLFRGRSKSSRTSGGGSLKKRKYSTNSNSGGSNRSSNKQNHPNGKQHHENNDFTEAKSVANKTERTVV